MEKIIVIGCPGSGKSTFAKALSEITGLPLYHLDNIFWNKDRTNVSDKVFMQRLEDILSLDRWIIDGNYSSSMELRFKSCDTVFFLDLPAKTCIESVRERIGKPRSDMPWFEEKEDPAFIEFIKSYENEGRKQALSLMFQYPEKDMHIFMNRMDVNDYLEALRDHYSDIKHLA